MTHREAQTLGKVYDVDILQLACLVACDVRPRFRQGFFNDVIGQDGDVINGCDVDSAATDGVVQDGGVKGRGEGGKRGKGVTIMSRRHAVWPSPPPGPKEPSWA
jgi:hypothetical protein